MRYFDYVLIHGFTKKNIVTIRDIYPNTKIALLNPGNIIYYKWHKSADRNLKKFLEKYIDLVIVRTFVWKNLVESILQIPVYEFLDIEESFISEPKTFNRDLPLVIGYHGNEVHFAKDFITDGKDALLNLTNEFNFELHVITSNAHRQPNIDGVKMKKIEYSLDTFWDDVDRFTIGICPIFSSKTKQNDITTMIRNGNRAVSMMSRGIPTIISPTQQVKIDFKENKHILYAHNSDDWFEKIKILFTNKNVYEDLSQNGLEHVSKNFSVSVGLNRLVEIFMLHEIKAN